MLGLKKAEKTHNCYHDLQNHWKDEENNKKLFNFLQVSIVFLLGALISQVIIFAFRKTDEKTTCDLKNNDFSRYSLIDYALDSNGAFIIEESSDVEYLGWLSYFSSNKRAAVISQNNQANNCWAFHGGRGFVAINLAARVLPRNFSIFHVNALDVSRAPKTLNVFSLSHENECKLLATFQFRLSVQGVYRKNSETFPCLFGCHEFVDKVLLEVLDNHGAVNTCVYQFSVHGTKN
jgi:hypothetical protein